MLDEESFYIYLKKKYPNILLPKDLLILLLKETYLYIKEVQSLKLKKIGNFFIKDNQLKIKTHKKLPELTHNELSKIVKSSITINQIGLNLDNSDVYNNIQNESSIVADSEFDINDLF